LKEIPLSFATLLKRILEGLWVAALGESLPISFGDAGCSSFLELHPSVQTKTINNRTMQERSAHDFECDGITISSLAP
jgi:hypothetical protein